ncbi:MFS transporter [Legionella impletisoli]|uniref:Lysosomal dipeptide transporter MFSD1 n=1 Tax=Legionella impletisoli TaxID=343510 RepID=A0A917JY86_9GAMM|nr:MFS transporter [Legionella impletisoli]GGI92050.1 MFS transporter [Legionella impletisoli]
MSDSFAVDSRVSLPRGNWMAWLVCLSAGLFFFYEFFQLNLFDVINQPLRESFHIDAAQISWMSSTYLWADILFLLPAGVILDRFSTRMVILTAMFVCVVGTVGFALTNSFAIASFYHFLSGIGNAFCFLSCVVLVSRWFPPRRQALVIGCLVTMAFIGGMMAHTPLAYLNEHFGWRDSLLIDGGVGALLFLWILFFVKDHPPQLASNQNHVSEKTASPSVLKSLVNPQNWLAGLYTSCLNLPIMVLCALWGASYLEVVHHLPKMAASNVVSMIFIGSIIGCPVIGWLSDTMGQRKPLMILGAIATLITIIPLFLGIAFSPTELSILFFALGFFTSTQIITYPLIAESNDSSNTGAATGMASVIIMGGGGVGQVLFGSLIKHHATSDLYTFTDFQFAMWMFPIATLVALVAILFTRETYCKPYK